MNPEQIQLDLEKNHIDREPVGMDLGFVDMNEASVHPDLEVNDMDL